MTAPDAPRPVPPRPAPLVAPADPAAAAAAAAAAAPALAPPGRARASAVPGRCVVPTLRDALPAGDPRRDALTPCPSCGRPALPFELADLRALAGAVRAVVREGAGLRDFACGACREALHHRGIVPRETLLRALGAPDAALAKARRHDAIREQQAREGGRALAWRADDRPRAAPPAPPVPPAPPAAPPLG